MTETKTWMCLICGWIYDEAQGAPEHGVPAGELAERVLGSVQNPLLLRDVERPWAIGRLTELLNGPSFA